MTTENQNSYNILQLLLNTLYTISETDKNMELIIATFKLRLISILGFTPNIKECVNCKKTDNLSYFSLKDNGLKCEDCGKQDRSAIQMLPETREGVRYSIIGPAKKLFSYTVPEQSIRELEIISKLYLNEKLEREYK